MHLPVKEEARWRRGCWAEIRPGILDTRTPVDQPIAILSRLSMDAQAGSCAGGRGMGGGK